MYFSWGTRNTVSIVGASFLLVSAIWNSYSKSETARSPRTITVAFRLRAYSTRRPLNPSTSTRGWRLNTSRIIAARSSSVNIGFLAELRATRTTTREKSSAARRMTSMCP